MFITQLLNNPLVFLFLVIAFLITVTFHEFMHAWTASYLGDPTPEAAGRVTLNPLAHLDPIGSLMVLLVGFGWAKPVPINPGRFKNPKLGEVIVSLAGPLANLFLAVLFSFVYRYVPAQKEIFSIFLYVLILINVRLMIFNLLPIPPLDGSHLLSIFITNRRFFAFFETSGFILLIILVFVAAPLIIIPLSDIIMKILIG